jgi:hypothetical protein
LAKRKTLAEQRAVVQEMEFGLGIWESQLLELQLQVEEERARVKSLQVSFERGQQTDEGWIAQPGLYVLLTWCGHWTNCGREHGRYCLFGSPSEAMIWAKAHYGSDFKEDRFSVQRITLPAPPAEAFQDALRAGELPRGG